MSCQARRRRDCASNQSRCICINHHELASTLVAGVEGQRLMLAIAASWREWVHDERPNT